MIDDLFVTGPHSIEGPKLGFEAEEILINVDAKWG